MNTIYSKNSGLEIQSNDLATYWMILEKGFIFDGAYLENDLLILFHGFS